MSDWFAPKRFGYGAGLPIAWQGWAVLLSYIALVTAAGPLLLPRHGLAWGAMLVVSTTLLIVVAKRHTRGGWKWRSGAND